MASSLKINSLKINGKLQNYRTAYVSIERLTQVRDKCLKYEEELATFYDIPLEGDWHTKLKEKINEGYGTNQRDRAFKDISSADVLYEVFNTALDAGIENGTIAAWLTGKYSSFTGAKDLAEKIERDFRSMKNGDVDIKPVMIEGNIDEYIASYLRGIQHKRGGVFNTDKRYSAFPLKVRYDIIQYVTNSKRKATASLF